MNTNKLPYTQDKSRDSENTTYENFCELINFKPKPNKHIKMLSNRTRVWDKQEQCFFQTKVGNNNQYIKELLFSQAGEIYLREFSNGVEKLTHEKNLEFPGRFVQDNYVGIKDAEGKKYFINDIVKFTHQQEDKRQTPTYSYGVLILDGAHLSIASGPINDYTAYDPISEKELREANLAGNIYQDAKIIMGDFHGHI